LTAAFHPKFQNLIACGCANGTTIVFDITEDNNKIIASSKIEESHREAVSSISWIKTKHHNEFVTTSTDRDVIFWTVVNFDKIGHPVTKDSPPIVISRELPCGLIDKESEKEYGGNVIEYNSESGVILY
jgi:WD40 repeat protein